MLCHRRTRLRPVQNLPALRAPRLSPTWLRVARSLLALLMHLRAVDLSRALSIRAEAVLLKRPLHIAALWPLPRLTLPASPVTAPSSRAPATLLQLQQLTAVLQLLALPTLPAAVSIQRHPQDDLRRPQRRQPPAVLMLALLSLQLALCTRKPQALRCAWSRPLTPALRLAASLQRLQLQVHHMCHRAARLQAAPRTSLAQVELLRRRRRPAVDTRQAVPIQRPAAVTRQILLLQLPALFIHRALLKQ